ncbi:MAG: hypothetical protein ABIR91_02985 [Candidatus Saccharimonadales bacterium]
MSIRRQTGDTIIEVMLAVVVFALVSVMSISIMNHGIATSQRSLEITQVRSQMDAQVNAIRYQHQLHVAEHNDVEWNKMTIAHAQAKASTFGQITGSTCPAFTADQKPFIVNARTAKVWANTPTVNPPAGGTLPPYSQVLYQPSGAVSQAYGIWVEAVPRAEAAGVAGFVDFHIRACWRAAGSSAPATLGTIVRLYEPLD